MIIPKKTSQNKMKDYLLKNGFKSFLDSSKNKSLKVNQLISKSPYKPEISDLYMLHKFIILNKRTTILEFGSGYSTLFMYDAIRKNEKKYTKQVKNLRRNNPFELFVLENTKKYLNITKSRCNKFFNGKTKIKFNFSECHITKHNNMYCSKYLRFPVVNPDFIYLDGPEQFSVKGSINGFHTRHKDMMPMVSDILNIENFLTPGTIIVTDGRGANAEFLKNNFVRKWKYFYVKHSDQHVFYLNERPLGPLNESQLKFYYGKKLK